MKIREFNTLTKSEIKKINKAGNGVVGEYFVAPSLIHGFVNVTCTVFDSNRENVVAVVELVSCLFDRRMSFITTVNGRLVVR